MRVISLYKELNNPIEINNEKKFARSIKHSKTILRQFKIK